MEVHPKLCHPPLDSPWHPSEHCSRGLDVTSLFIDNPKFIKKSISQHSLVHIISMCLHLSYFSQQWEHLHVRSAFVCSCTFSQKLFSIHAQSSLISAAQQRFFPEDWQVHCRPSNHSGFWSTLTALFFSRLFFLSEPTCFLERSIHRTEEICLCSTDEMCYSQTLGSFNTKLNSFFPVDWSSTIKCLSPRL